MSTFRNPSRSVRVDLDPTLRSLFHLLVVPSPPLVWKSWTRTPPVRFLRTQMCPSPGPRLRSVSRTRRSKRGRTQHPPLLGGEHEDRPRGDSTSTSRINVEPSLHVGPDHDSSLLPSQFLSSVARHREVVRPRTTI